jgi:hypothetical protein
MAKEYVGTETKDVGHRKGQQGKMPNENAKGTRQRNTPKEHAKGTRKGQQKGTKRLFKNHINTLSTYSPRITKA